MILRKRKRPQTLKTQDAQILSPPMEFLDVRENTVMQRRNRDNSHEEKTAKLEQISEEEETKIIDTSNPRPSHQNYIVDGKDNSCFICSSLKARKIDMKFKKRHPIISRLFRRGRPIRIPVNESFYKNN